MGMHHKVLISLGSNMGNRKENINQAIQSIQLRLGGILAQSPFYHSPSWGYEDNSYFNNILCLSTSMQPLELMDILLQIELIQGRKRKQTEGYQARTIDIDIVLIEGLVIDHPKLKVPHPRMHLRRFVLKPAVDIAPDWIHELKCQSLSELLIQCKDDSKVKQVG
jgi:2-amino-4-hydroxy-6-hydroxymethyldihydropteridine diphosphokinase